MHIKQGQLEMLPVADYGAAITTAIEWLGERYVLAKPLEVGKPAIRPRPPRAYGVRLGRSTGQGVAGEKPRADIDIAHS